MGNIEKQNEKGRISVYVEVFNDNISTFGIDIGRYWPLLAAIDRYWPLLTAIDRYWPLLTAIDRYWPLLAAIGRYSLLSQLGKASVSSYLRHARRPQDRNQTCRDCRRRKFFQRRLGRLYWNCSEPSFI